MRKNFVYFNGGWFSMLLSYSIRNLIHIHINNIFIDFIVGAMDWSKLFFKILDETEKEIKEN